MPYIYGSIVMTRSGAPMWSGWVSKPPEPIPTKQLCKTIADVFKGESESQDSSYLDAGTFVVASTADAAYIVSVICTPATPETEVRAYMGMHPGARPCMPACRLHCAAVSATFSWV